MKSMDEMTNKNKLLVIDASGHGRVVADIAFKMNRWQQIAFLDVVIWNIIEAGTYVRVPVRRV